MTTLNQFFVRVLPVAVMLSLGLPTSGCVGPQGSVAGGENGLELFVLGIAQDGGLPHFGCEKPCCAEARRDGRELYPASLGVHDRRSGQLMLLEATPRVEEQVARLHRAAGVAGRNRRPVDDVLVTHAHIGHYLGLALFGREVASTKALPVHCSPRFADFLGEHAPWRQLVDLGQIVPRAFKPGLEFELWPELFVTALPVPHRDEFSDTMAYRLRGPRRTVLFVPDVDAWQRVPGLLEQLLEGVDVAYVDGTFYDGSELPERNLAEIRHPLITRTMDLLVGVARQRPGAIRFIHLNHTNPALHDAAVRAEIVRRGFAVAEPGERVEL